MNPQPSEVLAALAALASGLTPDPWIDLPEWAERYVSLGKDSPTPGPYRIAQAPYVRVPMQWLSRSDAAQVVVLCWASQMSKSTVANIALAYYAHTSPRGQMVVQPTIDLVEQYHKQRLEPLWSASPALASVFPPRTSRRSEATLRSRAFRGGYLRLSGANSPASLSSTPIGDVLCDEISQWDVDLREQGAPLGIVYARTSNFRDRKVILTGTPTVEGRCAVTREFEATDQHYLWVPCPHCGVMQRLRWRDDEGVYRVQWEADDPGTAVYVCVSGCVIRDHERVAAVALGEARPERPDLSQGGLRHGMHLSALYSPWLSLADLARQWVAAQGNPELLRVFVTTRLAEPWRDDGATDLRSEALRQRAEQYAHAPAHVALLTAGVDVQGDRIEVAVWGWGAGEESWLVDYAVIVGRTDTEAPWTALAQLLRRRYQVGARMRRIRATCIDSGHRTDRVYAFATTYDGQLDGSNVWAVKGSGNPADGIWPRKPTRIRRKQTKATLYVVGTQQAKDVVIGRLRMAPGGPGTVHLPAEVPGVGLLTDAWFAQLTAERKVRRKRGGRYTMVWECPDKKRNEALDCTVYAYAALCGLIRGELVRLPTRRPATADVLPPAASTADESSAVAPAAAPAPKAPPAAPPRPPARAAPPRRPAANWLSRGGMAR